MTEFNEVLLISIPNSWGKQAYLQGFGCETITYKKAVNMLKHMEISESIYEVVVEYSYKESTMADSTCVGHRR